MGWREGHVPGGEVTPGDVVDMDGASARTSFLAPANSAETDMLKWLNTEPRSLGEKLLLSNRFSGIFSQSHHTKLRYISYPYGERERFPPFRGQRVDGGERCERPGGQRPAPHDTAEVRWCRTPGGRSRFGIPLTRTNHGGRRRESPGQSLPVLVSGFVCPQPIPSLHPSSPSGVAQ